MKVYLAIFLGLLFGAQSQAVVATNLTVRWITASGFSVSYSVPSGSQSWVQCATDSAMLNNVSQTVKVSGTGTKHIAVFQGMDAGTTYYCRPVIDSDINYDCSADTLTLTPTDGGGGSATCPGSNSIAVTMASSESPSCDTSLVGTCDKWTPEAPSGVPDPGSFDDTGAQTWTAAGCTEAQIETAMTSCRNDATNASGDVDYVEIPYSCDVDIVVGQYGSQTNPDICVVRTTREDTGYCPKANGPMSPAWVNGLGNWECAPTLHAYGHTDLVNPFFWPNFATSTKGWEFRLLNFELHSLDDTNLTEGGRVSTYTDASADLDLNLDRNHGLSEPGDPPGVVVFGCKNSDGTWNTNLNGQWADANISYPDADTVRLEGAAGEECEGGVAYVTQEENDFQAVFRHANTSSFGFDRITARMTYPNRLTRWVSDAQGQNAYTINSWWEYWNWFWDDGSHIDVGPLYGNNPGGNEVTPEVWDLTGHDNFLARNNQFLGSGVAPMKSDVNGTATDFKWNTNWFVKPSWLIDVDGAVSETDGVADVLLGCRGHDGGEVKNVKRFEHNGFYIEGSTQCAGSQNTWPGTIFVRNDPGGGGDETTGVSDAFIGNGLVYNAPNGIHLEGSDARRSNQQFRWWVKNVLFHDLSDRQDTNTDNNTKAGGYAIRFTKALGALTAEKFGSWNATDNHGPFYFQNTQGSSIRFRDFWLAPVHLTNNSNWMFSDNGIGGTETQVPAVRNKESADTYYNMTAALNGTPTFDDFVAVVGCKTRKCDHTTATGSTNTGDDADLDDDFDGDETSYNFSNEFTLGDVLDTISDRMSLMTFESSTSFNYDGGETGGGSGDEGPDMDEIIKAAGIVTAASGFTAPFQASWVDIDTIRINYKAPNTSACWVHHRVQDTTGEPTIVGDGGGVALRDDSIDIDFSGGSGECREWIAYCEGARTFAEDVSCAGTNPG